MIKKIAVLGFLLSVNSFANSGWICPKDHLEIHLAPVRTLFSTLQISFDDGRFETNASLELPMGSDVDSYQTRFGIYNELQSEAQGFFPYRPEFLTVFHLMRSQSMYREGFKALESESAEPVKLKSMYCRALVEAILKYKPLR